MLYCKQCQRYLQPPKHWIRADLESKELLTFCIKRVKGLQRVKLVDAGFIWTEPHSKRLKTKLTIQKEVLNGAILQQTFVVEFVVEWHMCDACSRAAANADQARPRVATPVPIRPRSRGERRLLRTFLSFCHFAPARRFSPPARPSVSIATRRDASRLLPI